MASLHESVDGVVVRVRDVGESDRYLSVLTAEKGRISILSKGSHALRGPQISVSQLFTYGNFEYYRKGTTYILKGGSAIQPFYGLTGRYRPAQPCRLSLRADLRGHRRRGRGGRDAPPASQRSARAVV